MKPMSALLLIVFMLTIAIAGCAQSGGNPTPISTTVTTSTPPATTTSVPVTAVSLPSMPVNATVSPEGSVPMTSVPQQTGGAAYRQFQGRYYSVEYPASWQYNESTIPLREYTHSSIGCTVSSAYNLNQDLRMFFPVENTELFYASIVDSDRDIWPRDQNQQTDYADIVNSILGNPDYCANTPDGTFTISGVTPAVPLNGVSFDGTRVDFGKIDSLGKTLGKGSMYVITGNHRHGVFTFYAATGESDAWKPTADHMLHSITLDSGF